MRRYRLVKAPVGWPESLPFRVGWEGHPDDYGIGDEFDREFTADEELDNLTSGLIEIVPVRYRVVAPDSVVFDTPTGEEFEAAMPLGNEQALIDGGAIERVEPEPAPVKKPARKRKKEG